MTKISATEQTSYGNGPVFGAQPSITTTYDDQGKPIYVHDTAMLPVEFVYKKLDTWLTKKSPRRVALYQPFLVHAGERILSERRLPYGEAMDAALRMSRAH
jgi:hypothetical protein